MDTKFWKKDDFDVFTIAGLENRMDALQRLIQPKFEVLGRIFSDQLSVLGTNEFFPHVAKHARRTVNPPSDSWVAFSPARRGYKALPHFQIGLWGTHLFIILAIIYENPNKREIADRLEKKMEVLTTLPKGFVVSGDHMKPNAETIDEIGVQGLEKLLHRLQTVKKAEFLVGRHLQRDAAITLTEKQFIEYTENTFDRLLSVYDVVIGK